jgi:phage baseplate assembly protein V
MIQYGQVTQYRYTTLGSGKKLEVKVSVDDRVTNWLHVKTQASSFLVVHTPVRIGDQVAVLNPYGNNEDGFVIRGLTQKDIPLPSEADEDTFIAKFNDNTTYIHNTKNKEISLNTPCSITILASKDVSIETPTNMTFKASKIDLIAPAINLDGEVKTTKSLKVANEIDDKLGTVTNHKHAVQDHSVAVPR